MRKYALCMSIACCALLFAGKAAAISPVETAHFRIVANGADLQEADLKKVGDEVEGVYSKVSDALGFGYTRSGKIEVRVYVTPKNGRALATAFSSSTIFLTLGRINDEALWSMLTNMIVSESLPSAPRWFREGLGMYTKYGDMKPVYHKALPNLTDFSFTKLEANFSAGKPEQISYLYAWAIVSYVMDASGKDKLKNIYKENGNFNDKFSKTFGVDLKTLEKKSGEIFAVYK